MLTLPNYNFQESVWAYLLIYCLKRTSSTDFSPLFLISVMYKCLKTILANKLQWRIRDVQFVMWDGLLDWWCCVTFDWISRVNIDLGILLPSCRVDWHVNCTLSSVIMKLRSYLWPLFWIILVELMILKSKSVRLKNWLEITTTL